MEHSQKMVLIPHQLFEQSRNATLQKHPLRETVENELDSEMRRILTDSGSAHEKMRRYSSVLQRYLALVKQSDPPQQIESPQPTETDAQIVDSPPDPISSEVLENISRNSRSKARYILEKIRGAPHIISWNGQGELVINRRHYPGTHIYDLIKNVTATHNISDHNRPNGWYEYLRALAVLNIPSSLISNPRLRSIFESFKTGSEPSRPTEPIISTQSLSKRKVVNVRRTTSSKRKTVPSFDDSEWLPF